MKRGHNKCRHCGLFRGTNHKCNFKTYPNNNSKGVREYNKLLTYFIVLDNLRGVKLKELSKAYKLDKSNLNRRIKKVLAYHERTNQADTN